MWYICHTRHHTPRCESTVSALSHRHRCPDGVPPTALQDGGGGETGCVDTRGAPRGLSSASARCAVCPSIMAMPSWAACAIPTSMLPTQGKHPNLYLYLLKAQSAMGPKRWHAIIHIRRRACRLSQGQQGARGPGQASCHDTGWNPSRPESSRQQSTSPLVSIVHVCTL
jgi:hypothetical protein